MYLLLGLLVRLVASAGGDEFNSDEVFGTMISGELRVGVWQDDPAHYLDDPTRIRIVEKALQLASKASKTSKVSFQLPTRSSASEYVTTSHCRDRTSFTNSLFNKDVSAPPPSFFWAFHASLLMS